MNSRTHKLDSLVIVYDADCIQQPHTRLFDPAYWEQQGRLAGSARGRGSALFLDAPFGPAVLRQYLRGGWPARISRDRYLFTGYRRSRPLAEFRLLSELDNAGLPVPQPLAAMCRRRGISYRGSLIMRRIPNSETLADLLASRSGDAKLWRQTGSMIRRFHDAGVIHADLNARNILVGGNDAIHLVDFDRARVSPGKSGAFSANLRRLRRSLEKLWPDPGRERLDVCWEQLLGGYAAGSTGP